MGQQLQYSKVKFFHGILVCRTLRPIPVGKRSFVEGDDTGLTVGQYCIHCFGAAEFAVSDYRDLPKRLASLD
jgi:hypothetical protein